MDKQNYSPHHNISWPYYPPPPQKAIKIWHKGISLSWWDQHRIIQCPFSYENKFFMSNNKKAIVTKCDQKWDIYIKQRNRNYQYTTSITQMPLGKWQWTSIKKLPHTIKAVSTSPQQQHLINNETQDDPNPQQQINEYIDISTIPTHLFTSTDGSFIPNLTTSHGLHISDKQGNEIFSLQSKTDCIQNIHIPSSTRVEIISINTLLQIIVFINTNMLQLNNTSISHFTLICDSTGALSMFNKAQNPTYRMFTRANGEQLEQMSSLLQEIKQQNTQYTTKWTKSHMEKKKKRSEFTIYEELNTRADGLATYKTPATINEDIRKNTILQSVSFTETK